MTMAAINRRRQLLILKTFQIRYIALVLVFMFVVAFLAGYTVYVTTWIMFGEKLAAVYPQGLLREIVEKVNLVLLLRLLLITPLVIVVGLIFSNRIAGPIYSMKRFLRKVSQGHYEGRLTFREHDELQDVAEEVNALVSGLEAAKNRRKEKSDVLKKEIEALESAIYFNKYDSKEIMEKLAVLKEMAAGLEKQ